MFSIIHEGLVKGMCDAPRFVKRVNDTWVKCTEDVAEAIAIGGEAFRGAIAKEHDSGEVAFDDHVRIDEQGNLIAVNENATADIGEMLSAISEAIDELSEIVSEITEV